MNDSLFALIKLNNDDALNTYHYTNLIATFLEREMEHFSDEDYLHPIAFYKDWYGTDTANGKKIFNSDKKNLVQEKIINRYFTGKTAEYLYNLLLESAAYKTCSWNAYRRGQNECDTKNNLRAWNVPDREVPRMSNRYEEARQLVKRRQRS